MSNNPNFVAVMSTDEIYFGQDLLLCATDVIQDHKHDDVYASINHTHSGNSSISIATVSEVETYLGI